MFDLVKRKLSLKVSLTLTLVAIPVMVAAGYYIVSKETDRLVNLTMENAKIAAISGAKMYGATLESGLDAGAYTIGDVLEPAYEEIKGFDFGENPRFHTKYDFYTDRAAPGFMDKVLESSPDFMFATATDVNAYLPTHNTKFQQPLTGDRAKDLGGNRSKRKFETPVGLRAAHNTEPVLIQPYTQDTGAEAMDVSAPIYVRGHHYGAFRVGVSMGSLTSHKRELLIQLVIVFVALGSITIGLIFFMLRRAMRPLEHLAAIGNEISLGDGLDKPIEAKTTDEIGQTARSMNRLRASLQVAMSRLTE